MKDEVKRLLNDIKAMCLDTVCNNCEFWNDQMCMFNSLPLYWGINGLTTRQYNKLKEMNIDLYYTVEDNVLVNLGCRVLQILPNGEVIILDKNMRE